MSWGITIQTISGTESVNVPGISPASNDSPLWAGTKAFFYQFGKDALDVAAGEVPYVGSAIAAKEVATGTNIYGEEIGTIGRVGAAISVLPLGKIAGKAAGGLATIAKAGGGAISSGAKRLGDFLGFAGKHTDEVAGAVKKVSTSVDRERQKLLLKTEQISPATPNMA